MVSYGPWRQDPDFIQGRDYDTLDAWDNRWLDDRGEFSTQVMQDGEPYRVTVDDLRGAINDAYDSHGSDQTLNPYGVTHSFSYTLAFPTWTSSWSAVVARNRWRVGPDPGGYSYNPPNYGYTDPDAIGIQFEGQPFNPDIPWGSGPGIIQRAYLAPSSQIYAKVEDTSNADGGYAVTGSWDTTVLVAAGGGGGAVAVIPGVSERRGGFPTQSLGFEIDLTAALADNEWAGELWTETRTFVPPFTMDGGAIDAGTTVDYGWGFESPAMRFVVRPPRYRFVYDEVAAGSYRRTFPRHDGLAGGPGRNYPPSRSIQSSNRIGGGYL